MKEYLASEWGRGLELLLFQFLFIPIGNMETVSDKGDIESEFYRNVYSALSSVCISLDGLSKGKSQFKLILCSYKHEW